ncbi:hypothetical protein ACFL5Q_02805 [Planctomycetota bacterium]
MCARMVHWTAVVGCLSWSTLCVAENVLFEDDFEDGLSSKWQAVGLEKEDYRIRDGGLELRVQPGKLTRDTPMLKVTLPFTSAGKVVASVEVTVLDRFTEPAEFAGLFLTAERGVEFGGTKRRLNGHLVFSPGNVEFIGEPGEEGDPAKYSLRFRPAEKEAGPLRIIVRGHYAHFQVGPSPKGKYLNFFHSAIRKNEKERGFGLVAAGGPDDAVHWVRFDNFRVVK